MTSKPTHPEARTRWQRVQRHVKYVLLLWLVGSTAGNSLALAGADWMCAEQKEATETNLEGNGSEIVLVTPHLLRRAVRQTALPHQPPVDIRRSSLDSFSQPINEVRPSSFQHLASSPLRC